MSMSVSQMGSKVRFWLAGRTNHTKQAGRKYLFPIAAEKERKLAKVKEDVVV